jgi:hypothetical protein
MTSSTALSDESSSLRCARHPNTETVLRCGRCDTPICTRCMIMSPVGVRCRTCAQVKRFSLLLKPPEVARAIGYGVAVGAIGTLIFFNLPFLGPFISFAIIGFGVGHVVSVGAKGKRVPVLAPLAVACLFVGYEVGGIVLSLLARDVITLNTFVGPLIALRNISLIVGLLIGSLLAWMRNR